ncbi:MAG TPA: hypothetical protein VLX56_07670 [Nitrososphaerales archaeon]|nr:hypothetical protein [Nitrososphaerales archaeon]
MESRTAAAAVVTIALITSGLVLYRQSTVVPSTATVTSPVELTITRFSNVTTTALINQTRVATATESVVTTVTVRAGTNQLVIPSNAQLEQCAATSYFLPDTVTASISRTTYVYNNITTTSTVYIQGSMTTATVGSSTYASTTVFPLGVEPGFVTSTTFYDPNAAPSAAWTAITCTYLP